MNTMKTLVTGCAGFVRHPYRRLTVGHEVIGVDISQRDYPISCTARNNPRFEFFDIDLFTGDLTGLAKACSSAKIVFNRC